MTTKTGKSKKKLSNKLEDYPKGARKLILTAERLFAQHGIDNVSLRQIVASAGQANNYAVQHHFGSKDGLIEAIYIIQMATLDGVRKKELEKIEAKGDASIEELISAIMLPILEAFDENGRHRYADFMFHLFHRNKVQINDLINGDVPIYDNFAPAVNQLNKLLKNKLANLPVEVFNLRYRLAAELFLSGINERKRSEVYCENTYASQQDFWQDMLALTVAVFSVPYKNK